MKFASLLTLAVLSLPCVADAQSNSVPPVDRKSVWFKPSLTVSSAPVCGGVLRVEQDAFFSPNAAPDYESLGFADFRRVDSESDPQIEQVDGYHRQLLLTLPGGQRVFVYVNRFGGCGGACETEQVVVGGKSFDGPLSREHTFPATPAAERWSLYKAADGEFYAVGNDSGRLQAYRIAASARPELVCEVVLEPRNTSEHADQAVRRASQSIEALIQAKAAITRGAGECGSSDAAWRYNERSKAWLARSLYRPWAVFAHEVEWNDYDSVDRLLNSWSLVGVAEHRALHVFREQLDGTALALGRFYVDKFGWPRQRAEEIAAKALRNALSEGIAFDQYKPFAREWPLRQAILERRPLAAIKQIGVNGRPAADSDTWLSPEEEDSVLNVAVEYPEALQYLLSQGRDPNEANAFGKTPLMYATQYNQLESARILLAAGADPNASTHLPEDPCYYTLRTSGMTPLHYAARYASAPLIRLLVANGALTFKTAEIQYESEDSPLDWLKKYTGTAAEIEKNPNITEAELPALFDLLRVPGDEERQRISASVLAQTQAEYALAAAAGIGVVQPGTDLRTR